MSRDSLPPPFAHLPGHRPVQGLAAALGLVLLAHVWLLAAWPVHEPAPLHSAPVLLSLREEARPAAPPVEAAAPGLAADRRHRAAERPRTDAPPSPTPAAAPPDTLSDKRPAPAEITDDIETVVTAESAQHLAALPPQGEGVWRYRLRQAGAEGEAWLHWQSQNGDYRLQLRRQLPGHPLPGWRSEGRLDALGLAPLRFAVLRGPREVQALNFRREQGVISYSASTELQPLTPATQDRLSWWLQLPALLQAWQARHGAPLPGLRFEMPVALIRGGLHRWQFSVLGQESGLWHLRRGALGLHDIRLDVWLDPARQYLPVRLHQQIGEEEGWEMELQDELAGTEPRPAV